MIKNFILFLSWFCALELSCFGQNFKEDMQAIRNANANLENYYVDITANYFSGETAQKPINTEIIKFRKKGNSFFYNIKGMDILVENDKMISVDNTNRLMVLKIVTKEESEMLKKNNYLSNLDSVLAKIDSVTFIKKREFISNYRIYKPDDQIEFVDLYLDMSQNAIHKVVYHYTKNDGEDHSSVVELRFSSIPSQKVSSDLFLMDKYISLVGNKYITSSRYSGYNLNVINND